MTMDRKSREKFQLTENTGNSITGTPTLWPAMSAEIEDKVSNCQVCAQHKKSNNENRSYHMTHHSDHGAKVGGDLFEIKGQSFMIQLSTTWHSLKLMELALVLHLLTNNPYSFNLLSTRSNLSRRFLSVEPVTRMSSISRTL